MLLRMCTLMRLRRVPGGLWGALSLIPTHTLRGTKDNHALCSFINLHAEGYKLILANENVLKLAHNNLPIKKKLGVTPGRTVVSNGVPI